MKTYWKTDIRGSKYKVYIKTDPQQKPVKSARILEAKMEKRREEIGKKK